jgi:hypothetical protein
LDSSGFWWKSRRQVITCSVISSLRLVMDSKGTCAIAEPEASNVDIISTSRVAIRVRTVNVISSQAELNFQLRQRNELHFAGLVVTRVKYYMNPPSEWGILVCSLKPVKLMTGFFLKRD